MRPALVLVRRVGAFRLGSVPGRRVWALRLEWVSGRRAQAMRQRTVARRCIESVCPEAHRRRLVCFPRSVPEAAQGLIGLVAEDGTEPPTGGYP